MLSAAEKRKYIRQIMLAEIGMQGQEKLKAARVAVVGCGGLGCPVALYLAAAGVGTLGLIDFDEVSISNLHRQVLFGNSDVGRKKTEAAAERLSAQHPEVNIIRHDLLLDESNAGPLLAAYDVVVDGCDNFATRYVVGDICTAMQKPVVYGSVLGFEAQLAVFNYQGNKGLRDLFPEAPDPADVPDCSENGVLPTVTGLLGTFMANECIKVILKKQVPVNQLLLLNCMDTSVQKVNF